MAAAIEAIFASVNPDVAKGDKRIVLIDGEVAGAINRRPGKGEFRSNLAVGGSAEATELTPREQEICAVMGPRLKELGLIFVGSGESRGGSMTRHSQVQCIQGTKRYYANLVH